MCGGIMPNGKEVIIALIKAQRDCEFSLRFFLQRENVGWKNIFIMLKLVKKGTRNEVNYDYGDYVLGEKLLTIQEGLKAVSDLFQEDDEKRKLAVPDYDEFVIRSRRESRFLPSKQRYGFLRDNWPMRFREFEVHQDRKGTSGIKELLRDKLPYYPSVSDAVIDFFELAVDFFNSYGAVYVVIIDYRARIESLKLSFSKAELKLDPREIEHKNLIVKVFAKSGLEITTLPDIYPESDVVEFDIGFQPDSLSVALLSKQDIMKIDGKEFAKWREEEEGIFIERPEEEILSLMSAGESQDLEYKQNVDDEKKKNDFIETVIAFLNTNRGIVLVGVSDNGSVIGTEKNTEDILKLIHDSCDPPPRDVIIEGKKILGEKVVIVDVPEGEDKPYQSRRDKNFYVRHNATDMKIERSELLQLLEKQSSRSERFSMR